MNIEARKMRPADVNLQPVSLHPLSISVYLAA